MRVIPGGGSARASPPRPLFQLSTVIAESQSIDLNRAQRWFTHTVSEQKYKRRLDRVDRSIEGKRAHFTRYFLASKTSALFLFDE